MTDLQIFSDQVDKLISLARSRFGINLDRYRRSCINRKVNHRMFRLDCNSLDEYINYLLDHPSEISRLLKAVTIQVTEFFRDPDVFSVISGTVMPELVRNKLSHGSRTIRIWSAGCASGEETYSVTMLFLNSVEFRKDRMDIKVYGTDISRESLDMARRGRYRVERMKSVPRRIKKNFFRKDGKEYRVVQEVKDRVVFSQHDLFTPSPLSGLDLIICRNVLIHFNHQSRREIIERFYRSLTERGMVMLGKSEAVDGETANRFHLINARAKVYRKISHQEIKEEQDDEP